MIKTLRKIRAKLSGTFVADCPRCYKHFYGWHAYASHISIKSSSGKLNNYRIICHRCVEQSKKAL